MLYGVPQGSIHGPLLFNLDMLCLGQILQECKVASYSYEDDTQIHLSLSPNNFSPTDSLYLCLEKVNGWMMQLSFHQFNKDKMEIVLSGTKERRLQFTAYLEPGPINTTTHVRNSWWGSQFH